MWRVVATLTSMAVCGAGTLFGTILILMMLGSKYHDNYEYYGINYPVLVWGPAVLGFLTPGFLVWYLEKRGYKNTWKILGTLPLIICNAGIVMIVVHYSIGLARRFQSVDDYRWFAVEAWGSCIVAILGTLGVIAVIWYLDKRGNSNAWIVSRALLLMLVSEVIICFAVVLMVFLVRFRTQAAELDAEQLKAVAEIEKLGGKVYYRDKGLCVDFYDTPIADAELVHLSSLSDLGELVLADTEITDEGLQQLDSLAHLKRLSLSNTQVSDVGLAHLESFTELQHLDLYGTQITDAGLTLLEGFRKLQHLDLTGTQITDAGLVHLQGFVELQFLNLSETEVTDAGLAHLTGLTSLGALILGGTQITDKGLVHLEQLTELHRISFRNTQISDAGLVRLAALTDLQWLDLNHTHVTEEGVQKLREALPNCEIPRYYPSWSKVR